MSLIRKSLFFLFALFAVIIGLYPMVYAFVGRDVGLLQSKPAALLQNVAWNIGFYAHIVFGGVAMLIGWTQFVKRWRDQYRNLHRNLGKLYVVAALISSMAGIGIGIFATGGIIAQIGFVLLGITWFSTTLRAFVLIRRGNINAHEVMMIYSYAACFAAVTLRIYLPILMSLLGNFFQAYRLVAWLCWVPNILVAYFLVRNIQNRRSLSMH